MCTTQGFPAIPFVVDTDLSREDGLISCKQIDNVQLLQLGWRAVRALKIVLELPWEL